MSEWDRLLLLPSLLSGRPTFMRWIFSLEIKFWLNHLKSAPGYPYTLLSLINHRKRLCPFQWPGLQAYSIHQYSNLNLSTTSTGMINQVSTHCLYCLSFITSSWGHFYHYKPKGMKVTFSQYKPISCALKNIKVKFSVFANMHKFVNIPALAVLGH